MLCIYIFMYKILSFHVYNCMCMYVHMYIG